MTAWRELAEDHDTRFRAPGRLPAGDVTFVFSDIVDSTGTFRRLGEERFAQVLFRHRRLLSVAWEFYGGHVLGTEGDSHLVAFARARDAVGACRLGQRALGDAEVRVRMGVHRGWAVPRGDEYVSLAIYEAARVVGCAAAGEIVITDVVAAELEEEEVILASRGPVDLRDFDRPIELFDVDGFECVDTWGQLAASRVPVSQGRVGIGHPVPS